MKRSIQAGLQQVGGAVAFYTCIPIPPDWPLNFHGIARLAPFVGLLIGSLVGLLDWGLQGVGMPIVTRSAIAVLGWVLLTGGLHLDGAMDTADGLAVSPERRLQVMADSVTGAFASMTAGLLLLLKLAALIDLDKNRLLILMLVAGWGRWGQLIAIAQYPYLRPNGKGALHKAAIRSAWSALPSLFVLTGLSALFALKLAIALSIGGVTIALATGAWFNHKLGGQTGDTYGAIVEWTEALLLCLVTIA
jgi:adenosylcobinamide-GDP ribazoletransferase